MESVDLNSIIGAAIGAGAVQLLTGIRLHRWALATHAWLSGLAKHTGYDTPPPHPAMKEH